MSITKLIAHSIIEHFQYVIVLKPMVRAFPLVLLVPLPSIIERLVSLLLKIGDLVPQKCGFGFRVEVT